ncbi:cryptochrome/photolyase family protein [Amorphus coralli]|uniref:cryptochrome/photolyase family protein n=1 Tax=Amorphus coralli TaxID=340680 RepID=UPI00047610F5|nr:deoxyribodipyrimidine photo-lyase [Amorphus coralli]
MSRTQDPPVIVWFRDDLRLADNPALAAAIDAEAPIVPVFIRETAPDALRALGGAADWWLHGSLEALSASLEKHGLRLILRAGDARTEIGALVNETGASSVFWNRRYHPAARDVDADIKASLAKNGIETKSFNGSLLIEPWEIQTGDGSYYRVYSPFARAARQKLGSVDPLPAPEGKLSAPDSWPESDKLSDWSLRPSRPDWAGGLRETWEPGEAAAREALEAFLDERLETYKSKRDFAAIDTTSRLSPRLRFGEVSPRTIWRAASHVIEDGRTSTGRTQSAEKFLSEVLWREFSYHLLYHLPPLEQENVQQKFDDFPWRTSDDPLKAWQSGRTGYPIVDAGMRQLWQTGWLHNRIRMVVASFLTKHLLIHWRDGEAWFWDTLVDADAANNPASWQWVAGSGADAAPYFRIFNPILQGKKFDPDGAYVRAWVPELAELPDSHIHEPWSAPSSVLEKAGVTLGKTYPDPIVDHSDARKRALSAYDRIKGKAA